MVRLRQLPVSLPELAPAMGATQYDREQLERLKALGYLEGKTEFADESDASEQTHFWDYPERYRYGAMDGELLYYLLRGDLDAAVAFVREIATHDEPYVAALARRLRHRNDRYADSFGRPLIREDELTEFLGQLR